MALKNFVDKVGPVVPASWLNAIDTQVVGNVKNYTAAPGIDCSALVTQDASENKEVIFPSGAWVISSLPTIPTGAIITTRPGSTFSGAGASSLGLATASTAGLQIVDFNPAVGQLATLNLFRNPHYIGGTPGNVAAGLRIQANVGSGVANYEWPFLSVLNNSATGGQNAAIYGQGNKLTGAGPTWAGVLEAHDKSGNSDPVSGLVALEAHLSSDGTDVNTRRIVVDVVGDIGVVVGGDISYGIRIGAFNGVDANCLYYNGIFLRNRQTRAITISTTGAVGIDMSGATFSAAAMRMSSGDIISFAPTDAKTLRYSSVAAGLVYASNSTDEIILRDDGGIKLGAAGGTPIIISGTQSTGASTPTLTANKPGANGGVSFWLSFLVGGTQVWVPAFAN